MYSNIANKVLVMFHRGDYKTGFDTLNTTYPASITIVPNSTAAETDRYFYHSDHLGSSSFISSNAGTTTQHLQYLPFGESFVEQKISTAYLTPYRFSGKEKDEETGYSYFGARYYNPELSIWLSVDPLAEKYPSLSPYNYCFNNPVKLVDPDGKGPGDPPFSQIFTPEYNNQITKALPQIAKTVVAKTISGPSLVATSVVMPIVGNIVQGVSGNIFYPSWAVPYTFDNNLHPIARNDIMGGELTWEQGKEIMAATVGVALPPISVEGSFASNAIVQAGTKAIVKTAIKNIPPNNSDNNNKYQGAKAKTELKNTSNGNTTKSIPFNSAVNKTENTSLDFKQFVPVEN